MQLQGESSPDDLGFCLSFSCYFSDNNSIASAATKVIRELKQESQAQFFEFSDVDEQDFEFSPDFSYEQVSAKQIDDFKFIFPVFDRAVEEKHVAPSLVSINNQLQTYSVDEHEAYSSSEAEGNECKSQPSRILCMWRPKTDILSSIFAKGKKRSSKKMEASKERCQVDGKLKASQSFHEVFYVQKRAEQKGDKMKSFLPYKQDLIGFFVNINRFGNKKLLF